MHYHFVLFFLSPSTTGCLLCVLHHTESVSRAPYICFVLLVEAFSNMFLLLIYFSKTRGHFLTSIQWDSISHSQKMPRIWCQWGSLKDTVSESRRRGCWCCRCQWGSLKDTVSESRRWGCWCCRCQWGSLKDTVSESRRRGCWCCRCRAWVACRCQAPATSDQDPVFQTRPFSLRRRRQGMLRNKCLSG